MEKSKAERLEGMSPSDRNLRMEARKKKTAAISYIQKLPSKTQLKLQTNYRRHLVRFPFDHYQLEKDRTIHLGRTRDCWLLFSLSL